MIRAGIIGWGENGQKIADALHFRLRNTEVVGVATTNPEGREYASRKLGLKHIFTSPGQLLELHQIDIICVCTEGHDHLVHVENALRSGSNVFIDQPLASNVDDSKKIERLAANYPSFKTTVAFPRRFDPKLMRLQKEIALGKLGDLISIEASTYEPIPLRKQGNAQDSVHKGIFMDVMLQDIDMIHWLTGSSFEKVYVSGSSKRYPSLSRQNDVDTAICLGAMKNKILVTLKSSRIAHEGQGMELTVIGTNGRASYSTLDRDDALITSQDNQPFYLSSVKATNDYIPMLEEYIIAVKGSNRLRYGLEIGTKATQVAVAMTKSFILGGEIRIEE